MEIYFLRHGLAGERSIWEGEDSDRPLTEDGKLRMEREAATMARLGIRPEVILTSPLVRAAQTAEIVAQRLGMNERLVREVSLAPGFGPEQLGKILSAHAGARALMMVGHEPDFSDTIGHLIGGGEVVCKKGGLACVEVVEPGKLRGRLLWLVSPRFLVG